MSIIKQAFLEGQSKILADGDKQEATKAGTLRGGNTGVLTEEGQLIGKCAALAYLRYKGIQVSPVTHSRDLMFDAGRRNEDAWYDVLKQSWNKPGQSILREEEIPTKWFTKNKIAVTGRPDRS